MKIKKTMLYALLLSVAALSGCKARNDNRSDLRSQDKVEIDLNNLVIIVL